MGMRRVATAAVMTAIAMSSGCGDDQRSATVFAYIELLDQANCEYRVRCGVMPSLEVCHQFRWYLPMHPAFEAAVLEGRIAWDAEAAADCVARVAARSCDQTSLAARYLRCDYTDGTLPDGAACSFASECVSSECWAPECRETCCQGVCVGSVAPVPAGLGEPCRLAPCAESYCADSGLCVRFVAEGEPCGFDDECGDGLTCAWRSSGVCERLPGPGELCFRDCRDVGNACGISRRCEPITEGSVCADQSSCGLGQVCDASSRCRLTVQRLGQRCSSPDGPFCAAGTACQRDEDEGDGTCQPLSVVGATCGHNRDCTSGWCDAGLCRDGGCAI